MIQTVHSQLCGYCTLKPHRRKPLYMLGWGISTWLFQWPKATGIRVEVDEGTNIIHMRKWRCVFIVIFSADLMTCFL